MDSQASSTSSRKGKGKKKSSAFPTTPPQGTRWAAFEGQPTYSPIFTRPQGPPSLKRLRSNTSSTLPVIEDHYMANALPGSSYFHNLFIKLALEAGLTEPNFTHKTIIIIKMFETIQSDYRKSIDGLQEEIEGLNSELDQLRVSPPQPPTTESPPDTRVAPESTSAPAQQPAPSSAPAPTFVGTPSWATVVRKGKKNATTTQKPAPAAKSPSPASAPALKKGITMRERKLIIKRDGSPLTPTAMELRDAINGALSSTYVQTVFLSGGNVTLTTMESVKVTSLNSKASAFLHLITGATTVHLDTPTTQLLVHGLPTSHSLATIATELTTFNSGLALTQQPRWLTSDESHASKSASSIVITITGPKAPLFVATSASAPLPAAGAPSHTPLGTTPAPLQPAVFEAAPAATSLQVTGCGAWRKLFSHSTGPLGP
ncbi:hypothetical protein L873DRAFT_1786326 [Choiromyces venosus 120613-1]|uniref:Uncharacterized protein n=1 Tax=Choiromyces venosus 120613-1 TaxID=1336337 RepID=A0A3N4KF75_9PEZI|nr:hypothetical protein L873DRAFT_1786326 [Choiromyces venosus 120613-1]